MLDTLIARQRITARYWFDRVAPLDAFDVSGDQNGTARLCFTDLALAYELRPMKTRYVIDTFDRDARATTRPRTLGAMSTGRTCLSGVELAAPYTILRIRIERGARTLPAVDVHLARDASGRPQVIGVRRR
jgi:hypothetical protein